MAIVGLGVDLVDVTRVERLASRNENIFRQRIRGEVERVEIAVSLPGSRRHRLYAQSVAAKEALLKALGGGLASGMRWPDIQVSQGRLNVPGQTQRKLPELHVEGLHVSMSTNAHTAMATVVLTRTQ